MQNMKIIIKGLLTGLFLQLAVGPIFFYIMNLVLQKSLLDGLFAVLAVTLVDYFYITLSILGIGKLLEHRKWKKIVGTISSFILVVFGALLIYKATGVTASLDENVVTTSLLFSFTSTFLLTISSPMTIVFYTGLFSAKAIEHNFKKRELLIFGLSVGLATFIFMGASVTIFSAIKEVVPTTLIKSANILVGSLLIIYGLARLKPILKPKNN